MWYLEEEACEKLLDAAVDTLPGRGSFFSMKAELVRRTKILTQSYTVRDALPDRIVAWSGLQPKVNAFASENNKRFPGH